MTETDPFPAMTRERYIELERDHRARLTQEEIKAGWHFCPEWDGMLIHTSWEEYQACLCKR